KRIDLSLDNGMTSSSDRKTGRSDESRPYEIQCLGAFRQGRKHVELCERSGHFLQCRDRRCEIGEQLLVEHLFTRERTLLCRERLVFERLELGRDVALGILERLAATIIVRNSGRMRMTDFDVEAMHTIEFDLETGDAGALALSYFQGQQKFA